MDRPENRVVFQVAQMDGDTMISEGSMNAAVRAAGAVCRAVDMVLNGQVRQTHDFIFLTLEH